MYIVSFFVVDLRSLLQNIVKSWLNLGLHCG
jgi:hypothetical protein